MVYERFGIALATSMAVIAVGLASYGQASADVYFVCFTLDYLVLSLLLGIVPREARRVLERLAVLFGLGVAVIIAVRAVRLLMGVAT